MPDPTITGATLWTCPEAAHRGVARQCPGGAQRPRHPKASILGCESIEKISDTEMTAKVKRKVGPVKASFAGKVTLSELDPPNGYKITGGSGGVAVFAKGGATVNLKDDDGTTQLDYVVNAQIGGKLAQLGARPIDSTAKKIAGEFLSNFAKVIVPVSQPSMTSAA